MNNLLKDLLILICIKLDIHSMMKLFLCNKRFNKIINQSRHLWIKKLDMDFGFIFKKKKTDPKEYYKILYLSFLPYEFKYYRDAQRKRDIRSCSFAWLPI